MPGILTNSGQFFFRVSIFSYYFSCFRDIIKNRIFYMDVDYKKLWDRLAEMGIKNKTELIPMAGISTNILAKL